MAIHKPSDLALEKKNFAMLISGSPGLGKTTLACSAPKPLVFDFDRGIDRMEYSYIPQYSQCDSYSEFLNDLETADYKGYDIRIYNKERMLIELVRYKSKLPFDYYKEIILNYRKLLPRLDIQKIQDYALMAPKSNKVLEILQMEVL